MLGQTEGFSVTCREEQGHSLSPQVSDVLTPGAPWAPNGHHPLLLSSSPGRVWNQDDKQGQGHGFQAGHDLGTGGPGSSGPHTPATQEVLAVTELCGPGWGGTHFLGAGYTQSLTNYCFSSPHP